jgi:hypothetical protein
MGREDRRDPKVADRREDRLVRRSVPAQPLDRGTHGRVGVLGGRLGRERGAAPPTRRALPVATPGRAYELALLGEVDEPEEQTEGTDDDLRAVGGQASQLRHERRTERRLVAAAKADRRPADAFDEVQQVATGLLGDHLAQERAQEPDLGRERVADVAGPDRRRLATDRVVRPCRGAPGGRSRLRHLP